MVSHIKKYCLKYKREQPKYMKNKQDDEGKEGGDAKRVVSIYWSKEGRC